MKPEGKKVSIIIPAYNAEAYLHETVDSVLKQIYKDIEIIIIDDGSEDKTSEIADQYALIDKRVVVVHQKNKGLSSARNEGIKVSSGELLFFLDSDDWIEPECINELVKCQSDSSADIVFFGYIREYLRKSVDNFVCKNNQVFEKGEKQDIFLFDMRTITAWGKLYTRDVIGNIRFDEKMFTAEDVDFNFQVYERVNKAVYLANCFLHYRILPKSAIHGYDSNISNKFKYPIQKIRERMSEGADVQKYAYYSFAAIAYIVICQNGVALNSKLSLAEKKAELKEISNLDWAKDLFENTRYIRIPFSRKILVWFGKKSIYFGVLGVIRIKRSLKD